MADAIRGIISGRCSESPSVILCTAIALIPFVDAGVAVIAHSVNVSGGRYVGFGGHAATVCKLAHGAGVDNFHPLDGIHIVRHERTLI